MTGIRVCMPLFWLAGVAVVSLSVGAVQADESKKSASSHECRLTATPPKIDGIADDAVWKSAQLIDRFTLPWLKDKERPSKTTTKARLLWDREYLYFVAELEDHDLFADITEHDGKTWFNDVFELFFKPAIDKPSYYEFQVNAAGTSMDMFLPKRGIDDFEKWVRDGDFHFETKVVRIGTLDNREDRDTGWTVEGRLPWSDFQRTGGRPELNATWKFALCRYDYTRGMDPELSTMAPMRTNAHPDYHFYEDYADLKFVAGPVEKTKEGQATSFPHGPPPRLTTSRVVGSPEPPLPYRSEKRYPKLKLTFPIAVGHQPGSDRLLTITQDAPYSTTTLRRFVDAADVSESEVLLPADGRVAYDILFHPKFAENGFVYIGHNRVKLDPNAPPSEPKVDGKKENEPPKGPKYSTVSRFKMNPRPPYEFDAKSEVTIIEWLSDGHNGAAITFGLDGMLYVTSGDGTSDSDTNVRGQDLSHMTAKVLRIDVDHPADGRQYSVPQDNPFVGQPNVVPETWAYGLRNPWRMTTDRQTGHIWVGNNGQDLWEQVYFVRKGDNYGWSVFEGSHPFYLTRELGPTPHVKPSLEHHHSESRSLTGGIVYYGSQRPELNGCYIYGDHSTGKIWGARHDGQKIVWHQELTDTPVHISGFGTDSRGELLVCDHAGNSEGGFFTLIPAPKGEPTPNFPRKLSESGLFQSVKGHVVQPALIPYSVNAPLWSDGTDKVRYIAIPGEYPKIEFKPTHGWGFPDETVLVKSFSLQLTEGDPKSSRWIETRFLTKQQNEWVGYSYQWNEDQTDATLVAKEGVDREFEIKTADGSRRQSWHYPSRTECMVCHSRAVAFVLGLSTPQMNKDHDYGGHVENQLEVLKRAGLFEKLDAPDKYERLANPYDAGAKLEARARAYLHSNCSICHIDAGGGNAQIQLEAATARDKMKLFDVVPIHDKFGLPDARLIAPGHPERSVLLHRVSLRGRGQMPQLATSRVDQPAVEMLTEWIRQMETKPEPKSQ